MKWPSTDTSAPGVNLLAHAWVIELNSDMNGSVEAADFRDAAVRASLAALAGHGDDPVAAGVSYCLPRGDDPGELRRRLKRGVLAWFVLGLMCMGGAGLMLWQMEKVMGDWATVIGGVLTPVGIACLFAAGLYERRTVRKYLREVAGDFWADRDNPPVHVRLEDAATYEKLKFLADDIGILVLHQSTGCAQIEGAFYRYLIYAADVRSLRLQKSTEREVIFLEYSAAGQNLALALIPDNIAAGFKRKLRVGDSGVYAKIQQTLKVANLSSGEKDA